VPVSYVLHRAQIQRPQAPPTVALGHHLGSGADRSHTAVAATESGARARPAAARPRRARPAPPWCARRRATQPVPCRCARRSPPSPDSRQTAGNVDGERRVAPTTRSTHPTDASGEPLKNSRSTSVLRQPRELARGARSGRRARGVSLVAGEVLVMDPARVRARVPQSGDSGVDHAGACPRRSSRSPRCRRRGDRAGRDRSARSRRPNARAGSSTAPA